MPLYLAPEKGDEILTRNEVPHRKPRPDADAKVAESIPLDARRSFAQVEGLVAICLQQSKLQGSHHLNGAATRLASQQFNTHTDPSGGPRFTTARPFHLIQDRVN